MKLQQLNACVTLSRSLFVPQTNGCEVTSNQHQPTAINHDTKPQSTPPEDGKSPRQRTLLHTPLVKGGNRTRRAAVTAVCVLSVNDPCRMCSS